MLLDQDGWEQRWKPRWHPLHPGPLQVTIPRAFPRKHHTEMELGTGSKKGSGSGGASLGIAALRRRSCE